MKPNDLFAALAAGLVFVVLAFFWKWNVIVAAVLAVGLYFSFSLLFRQRRKIGGIDVERLKNGEELKKEFDNAHADLAAIGSTAKSAASEHIRVGAAKLQKTGENIIAYLEKNPGMVSSARRFLDYYLDTGVEILKKYGELSHGGAPEKEMLKITAQTEQAVDVLNQAFEQQYTKLLEGDVMDIEGDIELLKKTLKMEELS